MAQATGYRPHNRELGRFGEDRAADWLAEHGFRIVDRTWRCARGEVDIVAWDSATLAFIEVKTRSGNGAGHPFEAITVAKLRRLRGLVSAWFDAHPDVHAPLVRIDAVAVHVVGPDVVVERFEALV